MITKMLKRIFSISRKYYYIFKYNCKFENNTKISNRSYFEGYNRICKNSIITNTSIGYASYVGEKSKLINASIGRYSSIGPDVQCLVGKHPTNSFVSTHPAFYSLRKQAGLTYVNEQLFEETNSNDKYSFEIGNDVWIGGHVRLLEGVKVGDGAIIAAGSVVTSDVAPYSIVAGTPAKFIKWRFNEEQIDYLKSFKWWLKDENWLKENSYMFKDINLFLEKNLKE